MKAQCPARTQACFRLPSLSGVTPLGGASFHSTRGPCAEGPSDRVWERVTPWSSLGRPQPLLTLLLWPADTARGKIVVKLQFLLIHVSNDVNFIFSLSSHVLIDFLRNWAVPQNIRGFSIKTLSERTVTFHPQAARAPCVPCVPAPKSGELCASRVLSVVVPTATPRHPAGFTGRLTLQAVKW